MAVFLVQHQHPPASCPTQNPEMVRQLANHVTQANADRFGVKILADWVLETEHTVILVLEADSPEKVTNFALPFLQAGGITVKAGQTCDQVARECLGG